MVRNDRVDLYEDVPRPVIALGNEFEDGLVIEPHLHRRSQLLYAASGAAMVTTAQGTWVLPPERGMWIPAGTVHSVRMLGRVSSRSLYLEPAAALGMPKRCEVLAVTPFMRSLLAEAVELPAAYELESRADALMALIQHEMRRLPVLPLSLPFPAHLRLAELCRAFLAAPSAHQAIDDWSQRLGMSRRAFTRLFRGETGLSFTAWRQQACLVAALPRLAAGAAVTVVALDLGYDNPAAFTAMFKRVLGASPRQYLKRGG
jgi:AraC-like DNA-binding protein